MGQKDKNYTQVSREEPFTIYTRRASQVGFLRPIFVKIGFFLHMKKTGETEQKRCKFFPISYWLKLLNTATQFQNHSKFGNNTGRKIYNYFNFTLIPQYTLLDPQIYYFLLLQKQKTLIDLLSAQFNKIIMYGVCQGRQEKFPSYQRSMKIRP